MNINKNKAIDLMIEDLHTIHHEIRCTARGEGCEYELEIVKQELLSYLQLMRKDNE